jgi:hypothetical protein
VISVIGSDSFSEDTDDPELQQQYTYVLPHYSDVNVLYQYILSLNYSSAFIYKLSIFLVLFDKTNIRFFYFLKFKVSQD